MQEKWNNPSQQGDAFYSRSNGADPSILVHRKNEDGTAGERPPLFSGILPGDYTRIASTARIKEFSRGELLYIEGDSVQQVLLLTSGVAKITQLGMSGTEVILRFGVTGDVLGATGLFCTGRHCTTAEAFRPCRALVWDAPSFKALVERFPVLHQNLSLIHISEPTRPY